MKKRKLMLGLFLFVALSCGIASFIVANFQKNSINIAPNSLSVEKVDGSYFLVAEQNSNFDYRFKLEQFIDGEYYSIGFVDSKTNSIDLMQQRLNIIAGEKYRFSAYYAKNSHNAVGKVFKTIEWSPNWVLDSIDYSKVVLSDALVLSWKAVYMADGYDVRIVDEDGHVQTLETDTNSVLLSDFSVGNFRVYIIAKSSNENITNSNAGLGKNVRVERKNVILDADFDDVSSAWIVSKENVESFSVYVNGNFVATLQADSVQTDKGYRYLFDASLVLGGVDMTMSSVEIKSNEQEFVFESDLYQV